MAGDHAACRAAGRPCPGLPAGQPARPQPARPTWRCIISALGRGDHPVAVEVARQPSSTPSRKHGNARIEPVEGVPDRVPEEHAAGGDAEPLPAAGRADPGRSRPRSSLSSRRPVPEMLTPTSLIWWPAVPAPRADQLGPGDVDARLGDHVARAAAAACPAAGTASSCSSQSQCVAPIRGSVTVVDCPVDRPLIAAGPGAAPTDRRDRSRGALAGVDRVEDAVVLGIAPAAARWCRCCRCRWRSAESAGAVRLSQRRPGCTGSQRVGVEGDQDGGDVQLGDVERAAPRRPRPARPRGRRRRRIGATTHGRPRR